LDSASTVRTVVLTKATRRIIHKEYIIHLQIIPIEERSYFSSRGKWRGAALAVSSSGVATSGKCVIPTVEKAIQLMESMKKEEEEEEETRLKMLLVAAVLFWTKCFFFFSNTGKGPESNTGKGYKGY
jgi:hypothetical protein